MKKLISMILMIVLLGCSNIPIFAQSSPESIMNIEIRPRHTLESGKQYYGGYVALNPKFDPNNLNYTASVEYHISHVRIDVGVPNDVWYTPVTKKECDLEVGKNEIDIDAAGKTYHITIKRNAKPEDSNSLDWISIETFTNDHHFVSITPKFDSEILNYNATVKNDVSKINISGSGKNLFGVNKDYLLKTGENQIPVVVTSKSGKERIYTFNIFREKSSDNNFSTMHIGEYNAKKVKINESEVTYNPNISQYKLNVSYDTACIDLSANINEGARLIAEEFYKLQVGLNKINVTIMPEEGQAKQYQLMVNRAKPSAELESLQINEDIFGVNNKGFTFDVDYSTNTARVVAIPKDKAAVVQGNGVHKLKVGVNKFTITVKAADGKIKKYPVVIKREKYKKTKVYIIWEVSSRK